jgi:hypothetical protein
MEIAQALDGRMPRGMEREDYDDENHEREQRAKMNADFQNFTKKVEDLVRRFLDPHAHAHSSTTVQTSRTSR